MRYEETYYGHRIVVTTTKTAGGRWTSSAELFDTPVPLGASAEFGSEDDARRDALGRAASALDRARQGKGKP
jgi:hypothetical protein